jgi:O-antigen ligase
VAGALGKSSVKMNRERSLRVLGTWLAIYIAILVGKPSEWVPGMSVVPLTKIAFLFALLAALKARDYLSPVRVMSLPTARCAILFLGLAVFSVVFSIYKSNSLATIQTPIILIVSIVLLIKGIDSVEELEKLYTGMAVAGAALTLAVLTRFEGGRATINERFDPNDLAYTLASILPIVLVVRYRGGQLWRRLCLAVAFMMAVAILLTGSRGGVLGLGAVLICMLMFPLALSKTGVPLRFSLSRTLLYASMVSILAVGAWGALPGETRERVATLSDLENDYNMDTKLNSSRMAVWQRNLKFAIRRPIGFGISSAGAVDGMAGGAYKAPHNSLVEAFVELGILGLFLFLRGYYLGWKSQSGLGRGQADSAMLQLYGRALRMALAGNFVAGFFLSQSYSATLWLLITICAINARLAARLHALPEDGLQRYTNR